MALTAHQIYRLALGRYISGKGLEESRRPEPLNNLAVLHLHDAVEILLQLVCEYLSVDVKKRRDFKDYWSDLDAVLAGEKLPMKEAMLRFNDARVNFKHRGIRIARPEVDNLCATVTAFLTEACRLLFGIEFASVSILSLVSFDKTREQLEAARRAAEAGESREALTCAAKAFVLLGKEYEERCRARYKESPYFLDGNVGPYVSEDDDLNQFISDVEVYMFDVQDAFRAMTLGVDFRQYARFRMLTPRVHLTWEQDWKEYSSKFWQPRPEHVGLAIDFVVETALRLDELEP